MTEKIKQLADVMVVHKLYGIGEALEQILYLIDDQAQQIANLDDALTGANQAADSLDARVSELQEEMDHRDATIDSLQDTIHSLQEDNKCLRRDVDDAEDRCAALQEELNDERSQKA